jgi:phosphoesterase RecJ-like protein
VIDNKKTEALQKLLAGARRVAVVSHVNPDGDALGSGLAWTSMLEKQGYAVRFYVPNPYPGFLDWMAGINKVHVYKMDPGTADAWIGEADVVFCMDFNQLNRLEGLGEAILRNEGAARVLIDHHLDPPADYELLFSDTTASSTALVTYQLIEALGWDARIDYAVAEALYVGMCTDTGNFSFGYLTPELFRVIARLVEKGVEPPKLNIAIYNNFSADRMRLMGYMLHQKMEMLPQHRAACMSLDKEEQRKFHFQPGDSEGFVNLPLSIKNISLSAFFLETKECIKVSLRSQGEIDVNALARDLFDGGGHKNASGGKFFGPMAQAILRFKEALSELRITN